MVLGLSQRQVKEMAGESHEARVCEVERGLHPGKSRSQKVYARLIAEAGV
jgi:hypothetical protein